MNPMGEQFHTKQASDSVFDNKCRKQDCLVGEPGDVAGIFTISHPRHKSTRDSFLLWVAYERNLQADQHIRRVCPLIGCEHHFDTSCQMQKHLVGCLQKYSGPYRCYKCWDEVKIGRYHTNGCKDSQNHGGRFATVKNSIRSAKKRLISRPQSSIHQDSGIMNSELHYSGYMELEDSNVCELTDSYICGELADSSPRSKVLNVGLSGETPNRLSELPSQSMEYGHSMDDRSKSHRSTSFNHRSDTEMQPGYQHYQTMQDLERGFYGYEPRKSSVEPPFQDHAAFYSAVSPTDLAEWSDSPVSPVGNEIPHGTFDTITAPLQARYQNNRTDTYDTPNVDVPSTVVSSGNQNWDETPVLTPNASNRGSYDLPDLSDSSSRKFSGSSGMESLAGQDIYSNFSPPMIEQDSYMYDEPEIYDDNAPNVKSYEKPGNLATNGQKWIFHPDEISIPNGFSPNPTWLQENRSHILIEKSNYNVNSNQHMDVNMSPPSNPTPIPARPCRMTSKRTTHPVECPCGFKPGGIQKNRRGNLMRHMKGCKIARDEVHPSSSPIPKLWLCEFPGCEKKFGRRDNLRHHQKSKSHRPHANSPSPAARKQAGSYGSGVSCGSSGVMCCK